jgi:hypothetical protein
MKKYSKGTTLIEIMVSLALISVVLIFMFNILSDLKVEDRESTRGSEDSVERASYTRIIQNDFINLGLKSISYCSAPDSLFCYSFVFNNNTTKTLEIYTKDDKGVIIYDNEKWTLDSTTFNKDKAKFCYQESKQQDPIHNSQGVDAKFQLIRIYIPTYLNPSTSRKLDLELTYTTENPVTITGISADCS